MTVPMRLLCLSDLHLRSEAVVVAIDRNRLSPFLAQIAATVAEVSPDAVVVTGDTVSPAQVRLLSATLRKLIPADLPVVVTLGNHEFWGRTFEDTLAKLKEHAPQTRRIPEKTLLLLAALGGGIGAWLGMELFRHKTQHRSFRICVPLFTLIWIVVIGGLYLYFNVIR